MSLHPLLRTGALTAVGVLALAAPAAAHVSPSATSAPAGSYLKLDLRVPHGCGETGNTTTVEVQIAEGITSVTPQVVPGWTIERTIEQLDPPLDDGHGGEITERTAVVTWTGGPLAHDQLEEFGLSVKLPDAPGTTITFPTIQTCDDGTTSEWIQVAEEGEEEPERPAPAVELTAAEGDAAVEGAETEADLADVTAASAGSTDDDDGDSALGVAIAGLGLGAAGLVAGGLALARTRRGG
jgi:uncharacterized protein YcnI